MKTVNIFSAVLAASIAALSCSKIPTVGLPEGTPVSFTVGSPMVGAEGESEEGTKITATFGSNNYTFNWEVGDQIALVAYKEPSAKDLSEYTVLGPFTAESAGSTTKFSGTIPSDFNTSYDQVWAIYPCVGFEMSKSITNTLSSSEVHPFRYVMKTTIAPVQDGSGFKYATFTSIFGTIKSSEGGNVVNVPDFKFGPALVGLTLKASDNIKKIEIQAWHPGGSKTKIPHYQPLCGSGSVQFVNVSNSVNSGGDAAAVLTIKKDDDGCYGDGQILFVTRQTVSNSSYGLGELRFTFTNSSDQKAYMKVKLYSGSTAKNISGGSFYDLGDTPTLTFK